MNTDRERGAPDPLVSVCIANFNGEQLLDQCLESVYAQTLPYPVEIIVHDDASSDASLAVLRSRHPRVEVIESSKNVGYCLANNRMALRARGRFLLLLNNDATLRPDALEVLVDAAGGQPELTVLSLPQYDPESGALVDRGVRLDVFHTPMPSRLPGRDNLAYVQGACLFIGRSAWMALGGFPEWMVSNVEDTYLCLLARLKGGAVSVVERSGYLHRQGTSFGGNRVVDGKLQTSYRRRYLSERNRACLVLVCTPTWAAWPWFLIHLAVLALEGFALCALMRDAGVWTRIYWPAIKGAVGLLPTLIKARSAAQAGRVMGFWSYVGLLDKIPQKLRVLVRHGLPDLT